MKKRILAVDDEAKILEVIVSYLEHAGHEAITAANGRAALEQFAKGRIDLIILDLMLPDITGEEVCRTIRRRSLVPILMLTAKVEEQSLLQGFNIGADDYLTKPFSPRELIARVTALLKRSALASPGCSDRPDICSDDDILCLQPSACRVTRNGQALDLTATEFQLLANFMEHPGRLYSRSELVSKVLAENFNGDPRTIDAHIKNLRHKIEPDPKNPAYIHTVHGMGYRFGKD